MELQRLSQEHAPLVLAFEVSNRAYLARFISDRGDAFFAMFDETFRVLLEDQAAGAGAFYVLVDLDGHVVGRFNLSFEDGAGAVLGYRVAEHVSGRGTATAAVRHLCDLATVDHGLRLLRAATSHANTASQRVLVNAGFVPVGPAGPADLGGKHGTWYHRDLAADPTVLR